MDAEDEPNSYLKYLDESESNNAYLLENNEVGLFSVEPIFTEMESNDWDHEGFPLLLTSSLITEEEGSNSDEFPSSLTNSPCDNVDLSSSVGLHNSVKGCIDTRNNQIHSSKRGCDETDTSIPEICSHHLKNSLNVVDSEMQKEISFNNTVVQPSEHEEEIVTENRVQFTQDGCLGTVETINDKLNESEPPTEHLQHNQKHVLIQLINSDGTPISVNNSLVTSIKVPTAEQKYTSSNKSKNINDLFSTVIANKCKICSFLCEDLEQIKKHIRLNHPEFIFTHNGLSNGVSILLSNARNKVQQNTIVNKEFTVYICSECHGVCTDKNDLKTHMIQEHGLVVPDPESCRNNANENEVPEKKYSEKMSSYLDDVKNVSLVKKQARALQRVKCSVRGCLATFPNEENRKKHEKLHTGNNASMFKCSDCNKTFLQWAIARTHMYNDHGIDFGMIMCHKCNIYKSYKTVTMLRHMMIHSDEKPFLCSDCGKSFRQLVQLKNHEVLHRLPEDMPTWSKIKKCKQCDKFFSNSKTLRVHIKSVHENFKPFICNICGYKSARKAMLALHTRQHSAEKPHECDHCEFRTGDHNSLRKHRMKHIGAVSYQCPYCPYSCIQAGSIKNHFQQKHKDKAGVYYCRHCPYSTINEEFYKSHEKTHEMSSKGERK